MSDTPVVIVPAGGDDDDAVAEALADVVEPLADAVEALAEAVAEGGDGDVDEVTERLVNVERDVDDIRSDVASRVTRDELDSYVRDLHMYAEAVAASAAVEAVDDLVETLVESDVLPDEDDAPIIDEGVTVVMPDVAESEAATSGKRRWRDRFADAW